MQELVRFLLEKTGHQVPDGAVSSTQDESGTRVEVKLPTPQVERFIANDAKLMRSVRAILSAAASMKETKVTLEIVEAGS